MIIIPIIFTLVVGYLTIVDKPEPRTSQEIVREVKDTK